jgi:hypothetical protein
LKNKLDKCQICMIDLSQQQLIGEKYVTCIGNFR